MRDEDTKIKSWPCTNENCETVLSDRTTWVKYLWQCGAIHQCNVYQQTFSHRAILRHIKCNVKGKEEEEDMFKCDMCDKEYNRKDTLPKIKGRNVRKCNIENHLFLIWILLY